MRKKIQLCYFLIFTNLFMVFSQRPDYLNEEEMKMYLLHESEIKIQTKLSTGDFIAELILSQPFEKQSLEQIRNIIEKRETKIAINNFVFINDDQKRVLKRKKIHEEFTDTLTKELIKANYKSTSDNFYFLWVKKDYLKLSKNQVDQFLNVAIDLNKKLIKSPKMDVWAFELQSINRILTVEQVDQFLRIKNDRRALRDVRNAWSRLQSNNLSTDLDSTQTAKQLYNHYINIYKAQDLYSENDSLKYEAIKAIHLVAPLAIIRLKNQKVKNNNQQYKGSYLW